MNPEPQKSSALVFGGLLLLALTLVLLFALGKLNSTATATKALPVYSAVADFSLTNQEGQAVSLAGLRGHAWVGDIIFTQCAGPCPRMTRQMKELQDGLPAGSGTRLITLTTDPDHDSPAVLKKYAER